MYFNIANINRKEDNMENYSLSDIASVAGDGNLGGSGAWVLIILFAMIFGWGGSGFGNRGNASGEPVTESGLCNAMNFNNLENAVGRLNDQAQNQYMGLSNGLSNLGYESLRNFNALQTQISDCCCTTQRAIDGVNYNNAMNTASINANTTAQVQKILDVMCQNKQEAMQAQINQLQLQNALAGVVRYPNGFMYSAGNNPFCGCNSNCC